MSKAMPTPGTVEKRKIGSLSYKFLSVEDEDGSRWSLLPSSLRVGQRVSVVNVGIGASVRLGTVVKSEFSRAGRPGSAIRFASELGVLGSFLEENYHDENARHFIISVENDPAFASQPEDAPEADASQHLPWWVPCASHHLPWWVAQHSTSAVSAADRMVATIASRVSQQPVLNTILEMKQYVSSVGQGYVHTILLGANAHVALIRELTSPSAAPGMRDTVMQTGLADIKIYDATVDLTASDMLRLEGKLDTDDVYVIRVPLCTKPSYQYDNWIRSGFSNAKNDPYIKAIRDKFKTLSVPSLTDAEIKSIARAHQPEDNCGIPTLTRVARAVHRVASWADVRPVWIQVPVRVDGHTPAPVGPLRMPESTGAHKSSENTLDVGNLFFR